MKVIGGGRSAVLIVSARATVWARVPQTNIVYEGALRNTLAAWLRRTEVIDAAKALDLAPARILIVRRYFGAQRIWGE